MKRSGRGSKRFFMNCKNAKCKNKNLITCDLTQIQINSNLRSLCYNIQLCLLFIYFFTSSTINGTQPVSRNVLSNKIMNYMYYIFFLKLN